jgi:uncharacterized membrane protein YphA (DoxX/SURF4 family)
VAAKQQFTILYFKVFLAGFHSRTIFISEAGLPMINQELTIPRKMGMFFIRTLLGTIFLMQGYGKIFTMGVPYVYERFFKVFETSFLPKWLIVSTAYYTSCVELIGGLLLITGLFRIYALCLLALDLLIVSFGHGLMEPIWELSHVIPRAVLLSALFLLPFVWDTWSMDEWIKKRMK